MQYANSGMEPMSPNNGIGVLQFRCNICGTVCQAHMSLLSREQDSCQHCGSTVRMRAMIHVLSEELFGESLALPDFPQCQDIKGFGMSDWEGYARLLAKKFNYTNTFYHAKPHLDITRIDQELEGSLDFLISTDVFEHVAPPVSQAFSNARKLLKKEGVFIFSVPYKLQGDTVEHFPELFDYRIEPRNGIPTLINMTCDGRRQEFQDLVFHGGPGETLEMRVFSRSSLQQEFAQAGFTSIEFYARHYFEYGIYWPYFSGVPIAARVVGQRAKVNQPSPPYKVIAWGPNETTLNQGFNIQANGDSALWLRGHNLQYIRTLKWGDTVLSAPTVAHAGQVLSTTVAPHLLSQTGEYPLYAVVTSGAEYLIGNFYVRPKA